MPDPKAQIEHIIVLMLENRSFDHMFGFFDIDQPLVPGDRLDNLLHAPPQQNLDSRERPIAPSKDARYAGDYRVDPGHHFPDVTYQLFEKNVADSTDTPTMGGFVRDYEAQPGGSVDASARVMKCFEPQKLPALTTLAREFAVCDRWFSAIPGPTLPNRAFAHAATSLGHVDMNPVAYWNAATLYERLDGAGVRSKVYSHDGNTLAFTFRKLFLGGGKFLGSYNDFLNDLGGKKLPAYCFVEPRFNDWYDEGNHQFYFANDQHPDNNVAEGELLIQEVYEAIRKSKYWEKTLFVITYDEHGGFFDHVHPPQTIASGQEGAHASFDFKRLGVRVPTVLISPFIERGTILHDEFEHSSIAATARTLLAKTMTPLTARDAAAKPLDGIFNRSTPRTDALKKIPMKVKGSDLRPSDIDSNTHGSASLSDQQRNQVLAAYYIDLDHPPGERVIGQPGFEVLENVNTEQKAALYIKAVSERTR